MSQGYKFSTVMGFHFHRYWEGELCLHLKWCVDELRKKIHDWWTGVLEAIFKGRLLSQMIIPLSGRGKWMISYLLCVVKVLRWNLFINNVPNCLMNFRNKKPHWSISKGGFKTIAGRRGFKWDLKCHNQRVIQNIMPSNGFLSLLAHFPHPDSLTISVQIKRK